MEQCFGESLLSGIGESCGRTRMIRMVNESEKDPIMRVHLSAQVRLP
jgi:hypothetical protein